MPIDESLRQQLLSRGMNDKLAELEDSEKKTKVGFKSILKEVPSASKKIGKAVAEAVLPLGTDAGIALATPRVLSQQKQAQSQQKELETKAFSYLKDPNIAPEYKQRILNSLSKTNPNLISQVKELQKTPGKVIGDTIVTGLNAALLGKASGMKFFVPSSQAGILAGEAATEIGALGKTTILANGVKLVPSIGSKVAGTLIRSLATATEGGLFGLGIALQSGKNKKDTAKETAGFAAANVFIPPIAGKVFKFTAENIGKIATEANMKAKIMGEYLKDFSKISTKKSSGNFFIDTANTNPATVKQTLASMGSKIIEKMSAPLEGKLLDRASILKNVDNITNRVSGQSVERTPDSVYEKYRIYAGTPQGKFTIAADDYNLFEKKYKDQGILEEVNGYSKALDALSRFNKFGKVEKGMELKAIESQIKDIEKRVFDKQGTLDNLKQSVADYRDFTDKNILRTYLESGLISKDRYDEINKAYPNWIPHVVKDYVELDAKTVFTGSNRSMNVTNNTIKAAQGSERDLIPGVKIPTLDRVQQAQNVAEKNKVIKQLFETFKINGPENYGAIPLRTAEQVETRNLLYKDLQDVWKKQIDNLKGVNELKNIEKNSTDKIKEIIQSTEKRIKNTEKIIKEEVDLKVKSEVGVLSDYYKKTKSNLNKIFDKTESTEIASLKESLLKTGKEMDDYFSEAQTLSADFEPPSTINKLLEKVNTREKRIFNLTDKLDKNILEYNTNNAKIINKNSEVINTIKRGIKNIKETKKTIISSRLQSELEIINNEVINDIKQQSAVINSVNKTKKMLQKLVDERANDIKEVKQIINELRDIATKPVDYKLEGKDKISGFINGIREDWLVPEEMAQVLKGQDMPTGNMFKFITAPATVLRNFATRYNIEFALKNPFKDLQNAGLISKYGITPRAVEEALLEISNKQLPEVRLFYKEGGAFGGLIAAEKPSVEILDKANRNPIFNWPTKIGEVVESIGERYENATRYAVFKTAIDKGASTHEAIWEARNATVDFSKMGSSVAVLNKVVPFLNARIQGVNNIVEATLKNPEKMIRQQMTFGIYPSALLYAHNSQYESYNKGITDQDKYRYWHLMIGEEDGFDKSGAPVKIPIAIKIMKGEVLQPTAGATEFYLSEAAKKDPEATKNFLTKILTETSPVNESSLGPLTTPFELVANYDLFRKQAIEPKYQELVPGGKKVDRETIPSELRKTRWTGETAQNLSELGLGKLGLSPARIEFIIGKIFAAPGNQILDLVDMTQTEFNKPDVKKQYDETTWQKVSQAPILKAFLNSSAGAEKIFLYDTLDKVSKETVEKIELPKELEAFSIYEQAYSLAKTKGGDAANKYIQEQNLSADMKKRIERIHKNTKAGESNYKQVYDIIPDNTTKVKWLVNVLNAVDSRAKKDEIIKDLKISKDIKKELQRAINAGALKKPVTD